MHICPGLLYFAIGTKVTANALHPGSVSSELVRHSFVMSWLWKIFSFFLKSPCEGAQTSIYCAVAEELESVTGQYFRWVQADEVILCGRQLRWLGNMGLFLYPPHMRAVGVIVSLQSFLLVICDQINLCNDIA